MVTTFFLKPDKKVSPAKVGQVLSSHFTGTKYSSYGKWKGGYRPINVPTDVESHILHVPKEYAAIQWLAMASSANSVYLPFYTNISDTPSQYKVDVTATTRTRLIPSPPTGLTKLRPW
ncbi:C69 family dipeptidase [Lactobacillus delbrueckii]|uniref:C69 family dipeptidase n=1 Tax=Lactobacillus delbrueckii TaxID=1584 RepID=UPI0010586557|nr:C69 family dipeptidase [Lactobacillus delbrueckii]